MNTIQAKSVFHQPADIPQHLLIWQDENSGIAALVQAADDIIAGKKVHFALCSREGTSTPTIDEVVTLAMGADGPRYCGEDADPQGAGSHALIASWYAYCKDPASIAVALALAFKAHKHYFRLR